MRFAHTLKSFVAASLVMGLLAACATDGSGSFNKREMGAIGGAVLGGVLGSQVGGGRGQLIATGAGTLLGALMGSEIGRSLDKADMMYAQKALGQAHQAPLGETITWSNPENGNRGSYTPVQVGRTPDERVCRKYEQTIIIDGRAETGVGTACENNDGTWDIVNS